MLLNCPVEKNEKVMPAVTDRPYSRFKKLVELVHASGVETYFQLSCIIVKKHDFLLHRRRSMTHQNDILRDIY